MKFLRKIQRTYLSKIFRLFLVSFEPIFLNFWKEHPALFIGIHLLWGCASALSWNPSYLFALLILWLPLKKRDWLKGFLLIAGAFVYTHYLYPSSPHEDKREGVGYLSLSSLKQYHSPFQHAFLYQGILKSFHPQSGKPLHHLPCQVFVPIRQERPQADCDYLIHGTLCQKGPHSYLLKPDKTRAWKPVDNTFSLSEWRYLFKKRVRSYFKTLFPHPKTLDFLTALATGDLEDRTLSFEFGRLGLQHILAISGFHFGILAAFCGFLLRLFFPRRLALFLSLILLSAYFFLIGNSPSVQRAWIAIVIFLIGMLCNLRTSALNAMGIALLVELILDPLCLTQVGFQLSFLCTFAILLAYSPLHRLLTRLLPERPLSQIATMSSFHQHGYVLSSLIRQSLALNGAVHLFAVPVLLYLFHKFPLLSLAYNLFFPFWVSLSIVLLLLSLLFTLILPPFGMLLHQANHLFTSFLLEMVSHPPAALNSVLWVKPFPFSLLIIFLSLAFMLLVYRRQMEKI